MPFFRRIIVPCLLLLVGLGLTIWGAGYHAITVAEVTEEEVKIPVPSPFGPPPDGNGFPFPGGPPLPEGQPIPEGVPAPDTPFPGAAPVPEDGATPPNRPMPGELAPPMDLSSLPMGPGWQPPMIVTKAIRTTYSDETEPKVMWLASVGGVTRLESGEIRKTFSGDEGPALCPT